MNVITKTKFKKKLKIFVFIVDYFKVYTIYINFMKMIA